MIELVCKVLCKLGLLKHFTYRDIVESTFAEKYVRPFCSDLFRGDIEIQHIKREVVCEDYYYYLRRGKKVRVFTTPSNGVSEHFYLLGRMNNIKVLLGDKYYDIYVMPTIKYCFLNNKITGRPTSPVNVPTETFDFSELRNAEIVRYLPKEVIFDDKPFLPYYEDMYEAFIKALNSRKLSYYRKE